MITRIEAYQYRCFRKLAVDLGRFHVLAGPNGAGKTTLLDIPGLLGDLLQPRQPVSDAFLVPQGGAAVPRAHTVSELMHCGRGNEFTLTVEAKLDDDIARKHADETTGHLSQLQPTHLRYEIRFEVFNGTDLQIAEEYLFLFNEYRNPPVLGQILQGQPQGPKRETAHKGWRYIIRRERGEPPFFLPELSRRKAGSRQLRPDRLALATLPEDREMYPAALWFLDLLQQDAVNYAPDWAGLRTASPPGGAREPLRADARNTPWLAKTLRETDEERYQAWVEHVQTALPQIEAIDVRIREEDRYAYFDVRYRGGHRVTSSGLSDGTLRVFALSLLSYLPEAPRMLVTEEPENGIHPRAIETVVQSLESMYDTQVWMSTHSPLVLANVELRDVLAAQLNGDGQVTVIRGDQHPRLKDWQGALDIGTLFAAGVFS